jgi:hypothetical protein
MTDVWWAGDATEEPRIVPGPGPSGEQPELVGAAREAVRAFVSAVRAPVAGCANVLNESFRTSLRLVVEAGEGWG